MWVGSDRAVSNSDTYRAKHINHSRISRGAMFCVLVFCVLVLDSFRFFFSIQFFIHSRST